MLHQSALQLVDICLQRCVAIGQCEIHLFQLLDLLLEVLHELLVLPSQGFMLKIVAVDELIMTCLQLPVAFEHLVKLLIQTILVGLHAVQLLVDLFTFAPLNLQLVLQLLLTLHGDTSYISGPRAGAETWALALSQR